MMRRVALGVGLKLDWDVSLKRYDTLHDILFLSIMRLVIDFQRLLLTMLKLLNNSLIVN